MEIVFELLAELVLEIAAEILVELGIHSSEHKRKPRPWLTLIGYAIIGALIGGISLLIFPEYFIRNEDLQILNLVLTPILAGGMICLLDRQRRRHTSSSWHFRFLCGFVFAFSMALVRMWAQTPV
ncbi:MAG: hypothetical protein Q4D78_11360 [Neisseria zoodegmatis]|uniref:hypothetical protein n=1 Tax=Neisseria zoodegmatis TaxID=326523 RepID=UPI0026F2D9F7|nr:hypothetical protein [Neisseria zoodegmatis]MDO5070767.1 hypothetical protein [Neisseria zoodegmatis]